jgi:hypothetical protein
MIREPGHVYPKSINRKVFEYGLRTRTITTCESDIAQIGLVYGKAHDQIIGDAYRNDGHEDAGRGKTRRGLFQMQR